MSARAEFGDVPVKQAFRLFRARSRVLQVPAFQQVDTASTPNTEAGEFECVVGRKTA